MPGRRAAWLLTVISLIMLAIVTCDDEPTPPPVTPDSGTEPGTLADSVCPDAAPEGGEGCVVPEGTTCAFGACGTSIAQCSKGTWRFGGNTSAVPDCPTDFPASESACPPCFPASKECVYGSTDCKAPDASSNTSYASCDAGRWEIKTFQCADGGDAGGPTDAGADVQGDADADTD